MGMEFGGFWRRIAARKGAEFWGLGDSGAKIGRPAALGGFCGVCRRKARPLPCRSAPKAFFWPGVGLRGTSVGPRYLYLCRQDGVASIGATQRVKTIAFWAIYTYKNTYWRLKRSNAQKTHHHGRRGRL